jgi:hypothetical protein
VIYEDYFPLSEFLVLKTSIKSDTSFSIKLNAAFKATVEAGNWLLWIAISNPDPVEHVKVRVNAVLHYSGTTHVIKEFNFMLTVNNEYSDHFDLKYLVAHIANNKLIKEEIACDLMAKEYAINERSYHVN